VLSQGCAEANCTFCADQSNGQPGLIGMVDPQGHTGTGQKIHFGRRVRFWRAQALPLIQRNSLADLLQAVLIFPGQLKDKTVGGEIHKSIRRHG